MELTVVPRRQTNKPSRAYYCALAKLDPGFGDSSTFGFYAMCGFAWTIFLAGLKVTTKPKPGVVYAHSTMIELQTWISTAAIAAFALFAVFSLMVAPLSWRARRNNKIFRIDPAVLRVWETVLHNHDVNKRSATRWLASNRAEAFSTLNKAWKEGRGKPDNTSALSADLEALLRDYNSATAVVIIH